MLDGFRILGVCLGMFMTIAVIAPQSEQPLILQLRLKTLIYLVLDYTF